MFDLECRMFDLEIVVLFLADDVFWAFIYLADGAVFVSLFNNIVSLEALKSDPRYPHNPTAKGFIDNFDFPTFGFSKSGIRMHTYFKASQSGSHTFIVSCDDVCELLFTKNVTNHSSAVKIAGTSSYTERFQWNK